MGAERLTEVFGTRVTDTQTSSDLSMYLRPEEIDFDQILNAGIIALAANGWMDSLESIDVDDDEDVAFYFFDSEMDDKEFDQILRKLQSVWKYTDYLAQPEDVYLDENGEPEETVGSYVVRVSLAKIDPDSDPYRPSDAGPDTTDDFYYNAPLGNVAAKLKDDSIGDDATLKAAMDLVAKGHDARTAVRLATKEG